MHNWPQDAHQYSTRLQRATIRHHPYCQHCGTTQNLETDHIIPLAEGGTNHPNNLQVLCHTCHQYKTRQEATRGTQRRQARKHKPTSFPLPGFSPKLRAIWSTTSYGRL